MKSEEARLDFGFSKPPAEDKTMFIQSHLNRVSRSFAFCIQQLNEPLREWIGVSYLICRLADTIEDSEFRNKIEQDLAFEWFNEALTQPNLEHFDFPLHLWPLEVTHGEELLLKDSAKVFHSFHDIEKEAKSIAIELAHSMSLGMRHFQRRSKNELRLKDLKEVNQYCFFVAGVVGEMLAEFLARVESGFRIDKELLLQAHHFGLFLQKVNLLKDQLKDEKLGRFLVPSRDQVLQSAGVNAKEALQFLKSIPESQAEFRRFCAWSLFLGLGSLEKNEKLKRSETEQILLEVEENLKDNNRLSDQFESRVERINGLRSATVDVRPGPELEPWFLSFYKGQLTPENLISLGIS